jgi:hypothetical protein
MNVSQNPHTRLARLATTSVLPRKMAGRARSAKAP